jgi:hypothetical protein
LSIRPRPRSETRSNGHMASMNTRTIAIVALIIAVIVLVILLS